MTNNNVEWDGITFSAGDGVVSMEHDSMDGVTCKLAMSCTDVFEVDILLTVLEKYRKELGRDE